MAFHAYTTQNGGFPGDDFLEENPTFAFQAFKPTRGLNFEGAGRNFFNFFENRQRSLGDLFTAQEGRKAAIGDAPAGSNVEFLRNFPWMQHFLSQSPQERGVRFRQPARWLIPR
jgi:hypothetical protein